MEKLIDTPNRSWKRQFNDYNHDWWIQSLLNSTDFEADEKTGWLPDDRLIDLSIRKKIDYRSKESFCDLKSNFFFWVTGWFIGRLADLFLLYSI